MRRIVVLSAVVAVFMAMTGCSDGFPISGLYAPQLSRLDQQMVAFVTEHDIPGASLAVAKDGRLVYARGFGYADTAANEGVQPTSLFRIASVSKTVTGMALSKLIEDGLVELDEDVFGPGGILNDAIYQDIQDPRVLNIQVWHLLTHTSGFPGEGDGDPQYDYVSIADALGVTPPASHDDIIRYVLANDDLLFDPGAQHLYSNVGYNVLGRIVEKKTGMTYEDYVRSLLVTVGASDMYIAGSLEDGRRSGEVKYYDMPFCVGPMYDGSGREVPCSYGTIYFPTADSHGGWIASAIDLLKFLTGIDGFGHRTQILTLATIDELKEKPAGIPDVGSYNGWPVSDDDRWAHAGALTTGTLAYLVRRPDEIEYAVIFNRLAVAEDGSADDIVEMVEELEQMESFMASVTDWPSYDLFEIY